MYFVSKKTKRILKLIEAEKLIFCGFWSLDNLLKKKLKDNFNLISFYKL